MAAEEKLAVTICATSSYQYAMIPQARMVHANLRNIKIPVVIILVGDKGLKKVAEYYDRLFNSGLPTGDAARVKIVELCEFTQIKEGVPYKHQVQLLIAEMRTAAFAAARTYGCTHCWSLDSDVIPKTADCYATLRWILEIPGAYYEVAISPYPSQGGGSNLLAGRGSPQNNIFQDFIEKERTIPADLQQRLKAHRDECAAIAPPQIPSAELLQRGEALQKEIDGCPIEGNVFHANAKHGWRRRGWTEAAFPGLGRGVIVQSDWCGFGCTLLGPRALNECEFHGYDGSGTEDLFVVWWRWHQVGIRIGCALHEPSHHVCRRKDGKYFTAIVRFVTEGDEDKGEGVGHLRVLHRPFYDHRPGEEYDQRNDGQTSTPEEREAMKKAQAAAAEQDKGSGVPATPASP